MSLAISVTSPISQLINTTQPPEISTVKFIYFSLAFSQLFRERANLKRAHMAAFGGMKLNVTSFLMVATFM